MEIFLIIKIIVKLNFAVSHQPVEATQIAETSWGATGHQPIIN